MIDKWNAPLQLARRRHLRTRGVAAGRHLANETDNKKLDATQPNHMSKSHPSQ